MARTVGYHRVFTADEREIIAYHWHPTAISHVTDPHLHLSRQITPIQFAPRAEPVALAEAHLPTSFITFADIVRLLITEFGVAPRRPDWRAIL